MSGQANAEGQQNLNHQNSAYGTVAINIPPQQQPAYGIPAAGSIPPQNIAYGIPVGESEYPSAPGYYQQPPQGYYQYPGPHYSPNAGYIIVEEVDDPSCAWAGLAFSWIPLIGFINFCVNSDAPAGSPRRKAARFSLLIATIVLIINISVAASYSR